MLMMIPWLVDAAIGRSMEIWTVVNIQETSIILPSTLVVSLELAQDVG